MTMKDILENPKKNKWFELSQNSNISMKDILENPDKPWEWKWVSLNSSISMKDVLENPDKPWMWDFLSLNASITIKDVSENQDKPWNWNYLSLNPNITIKYIFENPDKPWNDFFLSLNKFKLDVNLNDLHFRKIKSIKSKIKNSHKNFFYSYIIKHPSQKFYKWYCGEGGIGRIIDNERQMDL